MTDFLDLLLCPVCGEFLCRENRTLRCPAGHTYDLARAGYVNLLPPGKQKNARTGDEDGMVRARVDFLGKGFYDPIDNRLAELLSETCAQSDELCFTDMGAGEGYHTCRTAGLLAEIRGCAVTALGFDASKFAAERGCKLAASHGYFTKDGIGGEIPGAVRVACLPGNIFHLPLRSESMHAALSLFAPVAWEEAKRILKPGGILAVVSAGREHLIELRQELYNDVRLADRPPIPPENGGFREVLREPLNFAVQLNSRENIENLFTMTPFSRKTGEEGRSRLLSHERMTVTASVLFSLFEV